MQQIFRLLLENKSQEEIARELHISTRTVARYSHRIEKRYGHMQRLKTNNTIFLEAQLFKNRLLHLYEILEKKAQDPKINGNECAKCCEAASNIAIDVLKMESEGIQSSQTRSWSDGRSKDSKKTLSTVTDSDMMEELEKSC